ncbi:MAG: hypothetical protein WC004_04000 [Candidatus Absconditabacterales bacterium]
MRGDAKVRIFKTHDEKFFLARVGHYDQRIIEEVYMHLAGEHFGSEQKFVPLEEANTMAQPGTNKRKCELMLYDTLEQAQAARDIVKSQRQLIATVLSAKFAENYNQL